LTTAERERIESELRGTTLRAYWCILRSGRPVGVREVQRLLGLSSPSTALHHLRKLVELGILRKDEYGRYYVAEEVKVGVLRVFTRFGRLILPRYLFYASFFLTALVIYAIQSYLYSSAVDAMALVFGFSGATISVYETLRAWREKLF